MELTLAEFKELVDELKKRKIYGIQDATEAHAKALEKVHSKFWRAVHPLVAQLDPTIKNDAIRYANGDPWKVTGSS